MYRVVLIDDERRIVEGLRRVVRWADSCHSSRASRARSVRFPNIPLCLLHKIWWSFP